MHIQISAGLNAPNLLKPNGDFESLDTALTFKGLGRPVTRCYPLGVNTTSPDADNSEATILSWDEISKNWIYNEKQLVKVSCNSIVVNNDDVLIG